MSVSLRRESVPGVLRQCARLLGWVDELEPELAGAFLFSQAGRECGALLVEKRRVCWAISSGSSQRLVDFLNARAGKPLASETLDALVEECRIEGRPFGETLVARGHVSSAGLREALLAQTAAAVADLSALPLEVRFLPHKRQTYDPRYSFSTGELWGALGGHSGDEPLFHEGRGILSELVPEGASGLIFSRPNGKSPRLLDLLEGRALSAGEVRSLGAWAQSVLDVADALSEGTHMVAAANETGSARVAFQRKQFLGVALCPDARSLARVLMQQTLR